MRTTIVGLVGLTALFAGPAAAGPTAAQPLGSVEVRASYGIAAGGGAGRTSLRVTPLTLSATGRWAIRDQPRVAAYGGIVLEALDRVGAGLEGGLVLLPSPTVGLRAGAKAIAFPYTLYGPTFGVSRCSRSSGVHGCFDLAADVFIAGTDLPEDGAVVQVLFGLGIVVDAL